MENHCDCAIGVMAKAPRPGFSKTRLCPPLDPEQAAALSAAFMRDITENIALAARQVPIAGYVAYAPAGQEALFDGHLAADTGLLLADGSQPVPPDVQGFGRCLLHAIKAMLARGHGAAVVLNSDSPTLPTGLLIRTAALLAAEADRVVLGPAEDGGYYLLGMTAAHAHLFADIAWSTDSVAATTRLRAARLGLEVIDLPTWYDVDDQAALDRLLDETAMPSSQDRASEHASEGWRGHPRLAMTDEAKSWVGGPALAMTQMIAGDLLPYAAPFTALALTRMGLRAQGLDFAAE
jgi:rSAM/selenodomain-associated transferase 1